MKIVSIAFALLVFNVCLSIATHSMLTEYPIYYESEYINEFTPGTGSLPDNISTISEAQQYSSTMSIFDLILNVVDFGWLYYMIPDELDEHFAIYIVGIQAIVGFLYAVAIIELFVKRTEILGSSN